MDAKMTSLPSDMRALHRRPWIPRNMLIRAKEPVAGDQTKVPVAGGPPPPQKEAAAETLKEVSISVSEKVAVYPRAVSRYHVRRPGPDEIFDTANPFKTILEFFDTETPYSVDADQDGKELADFIIKNAKIAELMQDAQSRLQREIGKKLPKVEITYFKNWASTQQGLLLLVKPTSAKEVQKIIKAAASLDMQVGAGGAYHSWTPLYPDFCEEDKMRVLINICDLRAPTRIMLNRPDAQGEQTITISPGVTTWEMKEFFMKHNICFESDVVSLAFTYGGITVTGCHGTGEDQQAIPDWITSLKLVDGNGDIRIFTDGIPADCELPEGFSQKDVMNAVRTSLGVFGIIIEITMKVKPLFNVKMDETFPTVSEVIYGPHPKLKEILNNNWAVEFFWFPFNSLGKLGGLVQALPHTDVWNPKSDQLWMRAANKTEDEAPINPWENFTTRANDIIQQKIFSLVHPIIGKYPFLTPALLSAGFGVVREQKEAKSGAVQPIPEAIHFRYGVDFTPIYDMEFAFSFNLDDIDNLLQALRFVVELAGKKAQDNEYPMSLGIDFRVIAKSDCLLCPASVGGKSHTAYIEVLSFVGNEDYEEAFKEVAEEWMKLGGIPHWAKQWTFIPGIMDHIRDAYGDNLVKFAKVRKALGVDKQDMFLNKTMREVLPQV